ncbi:unnamed protein product [Plutella xylostella]|uniref:(diamondback moth) hypothetical protein n=1 Tax=Plutella xylostella TaxID=51655 RepID=A0A8S4ERJ3_PLUXY|nr:unnamed protein product [Plutella xylostella]
MVSTMPMTPTANDMEVLRKKEDEHLRLQRQFRIIQADRANRTLGVHPTLRRNDRLLRRLKKEYIHLLTDLKIAKSGANKKNDKKMKKNLLNSLLLREKTVSDSRGGVNLIDELEGLLLTNNNNMLQLRKAVTVSTGELEDRRRLSEKRLAATENVLESATRRYNSIQLQNQKIRDQIEHMLKDRALFTASWSKMLSALGQGKKFLTDLLESSSVAYDQRDEWVTKLRSVQEKGRMDQGIHIQEMRDLQKLLDGETKIYHFLAKKGVMRVNKKVEQREILQKEKEEEAVKKEIDHLEKILEDVYSYTGEYDVDTIVQSFKKQEQKNFSVYKLLTDVCAECEVLARNLKALKTDVGDRRDQNKMMEAKRKSKIAGLKNELEKQMQVTQDLRAKNEVQGTVIVDTVEKIYTIFNQLKCPPAPLQPLGAAPRWRWAHAVELITARIQEMVEDVHFHERSTSARDRQHRLPAEPLLQLREPLLQLRKCAVHVHPPRPWTAMPLRLYAPADPCPVCIEERWISRVTEALETPFNRQQALAALLSLQQEAAYLRTDRVHALADCKQPRSRAVLGRRYV